MARCPRCGNEVVNPYKTQPMFGKPRKDSTRSEFTIGVFEYLNCGAKIRAKIRKEEVSIKGIIQEIKGIEEGFVQTPRNLRERISALETEKADLLAEIEQLKKRAEAKVSSLEHEVTALKEEVKALKELLSQTE